MKKTILSSTILVLLATVSMAQYSFPWHITVGEVGPDFKITSFPNKDIYVTIALKDANGDTLYYEEQSGTLDKLSSIEFKIGTGDNPAPPVLTKEAFDKARYICWTAFIDDGDKIIMGEDQIVNIPRSTFAEEANNSLGLGGILYTTENGNWDDLTLPGNPDQYGLLFQRTNETQVERNNILEISLFDMLFPEQAEQVWDPGVNHPVLRFGTAKNPIPMVFGPTTPMPLRDYFTVCVPQLTNLSNGFKVKVAPSGTLNQTTAAIFGENKGTNKSAGVIGQGDTWGVFGEGANGILGTATGTANGAAVWGNLFSVFDFGYSIHGNDNGLDGGYAGLFVGRLAGTEPYEDISDMRLKHEMRSEGSALDKVMKLKPKSYQYRQDTPYHLAEGIHHGFIAQELEEVFPEIVTEVRLPDNPEADSMSNSTFTDYKAIRYSELISVLTAAIQELNTTLTKRIEAQETEIAALKKLLGQSK